MSVNEACSQPSANNESVRKRAAKPQLTISATHGPPRPCREDWIARSRDESIHLTVSGPFP
jgi:hypothetical protein